MDTSRKKLINVAPLVGAWIETLIVYLSKNLLCVAPLVGAWIETKKRRAEVEELVRSHPLWVRGLKLYQRVVVIIHLRRTPCGCVD